MISNRRIAVVIPAFNEEKLLPATLAGLPSFVDVAVVVDDASTDNTTQVTLAAARDRRVVLERHTVNRGVGAAIVTGYKWCIRNEMDIAVVVGADNQMDPNDMGVIVLPILQGTADYVVGNRLAWPGGWRAFPAVRLFGVVTLAALTRLATGVDLADAQSGYTAITRSALERINLDSLYGRYGFPNDLLSKAARQNLRISSRPVRPIYGDEVSGIKVHKVVGPILSLTLKNFIARQMPHEPVVVPRPEQRESGPHRRQA